MSEFDDVYIDKNDWCETRERNFLEHQIQTGNTVLNVEDNLLIYHGLGSGKTCTSILITELLRQQIFIGNVCVYIVTAASVIQQYIREFRVCPLVNGPETNNPYNIDPPKELKILRREKRPTESQRKQVQEMEKKYQTMLTDIILKNRIRVMSHDGFVSDKFIEETLGDKCPKIVIIDEIQNLVSETGIKFEKARNFIHSLKVRGTLRRLYAMTATPFYNYPNDMGIIMKLLYPEDNRIITERENFVRIYHDDREQFKNIVRNRISYFSGGNPNAYPFKRVIVSEHEMSNDQFVMYMEELKRIKSAAPLDNILNDHETGEYTRIRQLSNSSKPLREIKNQMHDIKEFSPKLDAIARSVCTMEGTILIYSNQIQYSIDILVDLLIQVYGYRLFNVTETRYDGKNIFLWTSDTNKTDANRIETETIRAIFNRKENVDGHQLKMIIGSPTIREGVDFRNIRSMIVVDPWWNTARIEQAIARAVRFTSHCDLFDPSKITIPTVNIYRHVTVLPKHVNLPLLPGKKTILNFISIEQNMILLSTRKHSLTRVFDRNVRELSVHCKTFSKGNLSRWVEYHIPFFYDTSKTILFYKNPSTGKKYVRKGSMNMVHESTLSTSDFELFPNGTEMVEVIEDPTRTTLVINVDQETEWIVGKNLTSSLVCYEDITCES